MAAIDAVLERLHAHKLRKAGSDRWRAVCPVCGERNPNTLSIGVRADGAVLLKCFKTECDVGEIAGALGLELTDLFPPRESSGRPLARTRMLAPSQALELIFLDVHAIAPVVADAAAGLPITEDAKQAAIAAMAHMLALAEEASHG